MTIEHIFRQEIPLHTAFRKAWHFGNHVCSTDGASLTGKRLEYPSRQFTLRYRDSI